MTKSKLKIVGLQKLSVIDYSGYTACTVFLGGCNFACPFCHNSELNADCEQLLSIEEFFAFLERRKKVLDAVCVSGGEPLLNPDVTEFISRIKSNGFRVKLDTNGSFPDRLQSLVEAKLVDYVAMDVKNSLDKYAQTAGCAIDTQAIERSLDFLLSCVVDFEFRTTLVKELITAEDIDNIARRIQGAKHYYLQNFEDKDTVPYRLHGFSREELNKLLEVARKFVPNAELRLI
ncbi:MAG: anaerobic ribonucleoside-triphosphate reductase activating protein [Clostridia bacterium]|nr:anaerobic ribonucleoside-triphosphate reductase activating protein [Clostridia bacterium]